MISCLNEIFVVLISVLIFFFNFYSAVYWKGKMISRLNEILFFNFFSNSFCFNFFSGKYWKRNVPSGVPYMSLMTFWCLKL